MVDLTPAVARSLDLPEPALVATATMAVLGGLAAIAAAAASSYGVELWFLRRKEPRRDPGRPAPPPPPFAPAGQPG